MQMIGESETPGVHYDPKTKRANGEERGTSADTRQQHKHVQ